MQFQVVCRSNRCLHIKWEKPCFRKGVFTESSHFKQLGGSNGVPGTDRGCVKSRRTGLQLIPPCQDEKPIIYCQRSPVTVTNKGYCYWMVGRPNNPNIYHLSMLCFWGDFWWFSTLLIWKGEPKKWAECIVHQSFHPGLCLGHLLWLRPRLWRPRLWLCQQPMHLAPKPPYPSGFLVL